MADERSGTTPVFEPALVALARSWNRLDPELLAPWLADDARYEAPSAELFLFGREAVLEYLRRKMARIDEAGEAARLRAELGWVRGSGGRRRACVISSQGELVRAALFLVSMGKDGRIERIEVCTDDPDPRLADGSGTVPGEPNSEM
jgi:hypothetical protein